ncbi:YqiA/YcfP family alpha/beta fold hydrolase [Flavobacterium taihuense]|uniref:Alpha/beta hydrolase n=1 Tax=Flavobacterium taihuense TaxID=2857508 RepID=A0ABS6Y097_9FLAO|nr:YqiA/YcfP family alpha/beta fold hydrolase [Flavobacterium taihuense]MBW4362346.1 alpha/beta hydrolase [Flavobacterium taihuense]
MSTLYLHGLESKLSDEKRTILEIYAPVIAPDLDYKSNPNMIEFLYDTYKNQKIDVIIGSSFGGFVGYHLANLLGVPCMLYNPALPYRSGIEQIIPSHLAMNHPSIMRFVFGGNDSVIKAVDNLAFLFQNINDKSDYSIILQHDLGHQIPITVFEEQSKLFFESLHQRNLRDIKSFL